VFNISGMELLIIVIIALTVLGPEKLPEMARTMGRLQREALRVMRTFYYEIERADRDEWRRAPSKPHVSPPLAKDLEQIYPPSDPPAQAQPPNDLAG